MRRVSARALADEAFINSLRAFFHMAPLPKPGSDVKGAERRSQFMDEHRYRPGNLGNGNSWKSRRGASL